jgi:hypothetical protein
MKFHGFCFTIILITFLTASIYSQYEVDLSADVPANYQSTGVIPTHLIESSGIIRGGREITAQGVLKVPIVFVRFQQDNSTSQFWPNADILPTPLFELLDSIIPVSSVFSYNNLSKYYDMFSGGNGNGSLGEFKVIGKVFYIQLSQTHSSYANDALIATEVLDSLDKKINFREFDNWRFKVNNELYNHQYLPYNPRSGNSADGILDFMVIFSRHVSRSAPGNVGGYAALVGIGNIVKDGILINPSCGVWGFNAVERTDSRIKGIIAHEIGHFQFGFGTGITGAHYGKRYN